MLWSVRSGRSVSLATSQLEHYAHRVKLMRCDPLGLAACKTLAKKAHTLVCPAGVNYVLLVVQFHLSKQGSSK